MHKGCTHTLHTPRTRTAHYSNFDSPSSKKTAKIGTESHQREWEEKGGKSVEQMYRVARR
jgi:hypothetical protein